MFERMHKNIALTLKLYEKEASSRNVRATLDDVAVASLTHTTTLPGGFGELAVAIASSEGEFWEWRHNRMLNRIALEEAGGRVAWEGRIEAVTLSDVWLASLTARGYWSNLNDAVLNLSYPNGASSARSIITDMLNRIPAGQRQLSSSAEHIATGPAIAHAYQDDWTVWRILTDARRGIASFGSGRGGPMDVAVWEDRKLRYAPRVSPGAGSSVSWRSYLRAENGGGVARLPLRFDWNDVANAISVTYELNGEIRRTSTASDADSIARHVRRERNLRNIGETTAATAILRRDAELNRRSRLRPNLRTGQGANASDIEIDRVWDEDGIEWPLCRVRAGDVLRIPDLTPSSGELDGGRADGYRAFFIEETRCDHASGVLTVGVGEGEGEGEGEAPPNAPRAIMSK